MLSHTCRDIPLILVALGCFGLSGCQLFFDSPDCSRGPEINEYAFDTALVEGKSVSIARIELVNQGSCTLEDVSALLVFGDDQFSIAKKRWAPGDFLVVQDTLSVALNNCSNCRTLLLQSDGNFRVIQSVSIPLSRIPHQYGARDPSGGNHFSVIDSSSLTLGRQNFDLGPVSLLTDVAGFRPRDSSANAGLLYRGSYWVLAGWSNFAHDVWYSASDVWRSVDGVIWSQLETSPPYSPYSAFVVFNDRMWALGPQSFSSIDGKTWRREPLSISLHSQAVVFKDRLFAVAADSVFVSSDGVRWNTVLSGAPWGSDRRESRLVVHKDRLWLIGGTDEPENKPVSYRNDVWNSADGEIWNIVTPSAEWEPRRWFNAISYAGMLWVLNGANQTLWQDQFGNVADIWISVEGRDWLKVHANRIWGARHASFIIPSMDDGFLVIAGYGHGGLTRMYGDVWRVQFHPNLLRSNAHP